MLIQRSLAVFSIMAFLGVFAPTIASAAPYSFPDPHEIRNSVQERLCAQFERQFARFGDLVQLPPFCDDQPEPEAPTVELSATPMTIDAGDSSILEWDTEDADTCIASGGWSGNKTLSGSQQVTPATTTMYTLACSNEVGTTSVSKTVTVIPSPEEATLTLVKTVTNDDGGTATQANFQAKINGQNVAWGVAHVVPTGTHTVSETNLAGYTAGSWGGDCAANGTVTIAAGQDKTCTITNDDQPATLTIVKNVMNDDEGELDAEDFSFRVNGGSAVPFEADGTNVLTVDAGTYSVEEVAVAGYTASYSNCTNINLHNGDSATCTITNNDNEPEMATLTLVKEVLNNNGGTTTASAWTLMADGPTDISGISGNAAVTNAVVTPGSYTLSETGGPNGYTASNYSCVKNGGAPVNGNSITLADGDTATCTITNDDQPGTLTVRKVVVRDDGDDTATTTFAFKVNGGTTTAFEADGENEVSVSVGTYTITEVAVDGFTTSYSNCENVYVPNGGSAICTITNNDVAPDAPTVNLSANPSIIDEGATSTLSWSSTNATACTASGGWSGSKALSGTATVTPSNTTDYVLACSGLGGTAYATTTVSVTPSTTPMIGHVVISEVLYDPSDTPEADYEWIELYNGSSTAISLAGWDIGDDEATTTIESLTIEAGEYAIIAATSTLEGIPEGVPTLVIDGIGNDLSNGGDVVVLYDPSGTAVDQISWGNQVGFPPVVADVAEGHSIARSQLTEDTNTAADWEDLEVPTPGM